MTKDAGLVVITFKQGAMLEKLAAAPQPLREFTPMEHRTLVSLIDHGYVTGRTEGVYRLTATGSAAALVARHAFQKKSVILSAAWVSREAC